MYSFDLWTRQRLCGFREKNWSLKIILNSLLNNCDLMNALAQQRRRTHVARNKFDNLSPSGKPIESPSIRIVPSFIVTIGKRNFANSPWSSVVEKFLTENVVLHLHGLFRRICDCFRCQIVYICDGFSNECVGTN